MHAWTSSKNPIDEIYATLTWDGTSSIDDDNNIDASFYLLVGIFKVFIIKIELPLDTVWIY